MGRKGRETTKEERALIIRLHNQCKSLSAISNIVGRPKTTIKGIIDRYGERKSNENLRRNGRPKKIDEYSGRAIIRKIKINPHISAPKIAADLETDLGISVCDSTVRNYLRRSEYHGRIARRKYFVSKINKQKRLDFAKTNLNKPQEFWDRMIYTDESKFNIFQSDGRSYVWRKKNTELEKENLRPTVKHGGGSVLVWGCMSSAGVGSLDFIDGIMDHQQYIDILKRNLLPSAQKLGIRNNFIFMQDNDPKHTAFNTKLWILYNIPSYFQTPPQSPDINPIEHLWDYLERKLKTREITSKASLKTAIVEEWNKIPASVTSNLVNSMPRRLEAIVKSKGYPTKY